MIKRKKSILLILVVLLLIGYGSNYIIISEAQNSEGWRVSSGRWWYEYADGSYAKEEYIDGYWIDKSGWYDSAWNGCWRNDSVGWWFESGSWYPSNSWLKIDKKWYYFGVSGYMESSKWIGDYYVQADGSLAMSKWIGKYYVGEDGKWIPNYVEKSSESSSDNKYNNNKNDYNYYDNNNGNSNNGESGNDNYINDKDEEIIETSDDKLLTYAQDYFYVYQPFSPIKNADGEDVTVDDLNSNDYSDDQLNTFTKDYNSHMTYTMCPNCGRKYWSSKDGAEGVAEAEELYRANDLCRRFVLFESELDDIAVYTNDGNGYVGKTNRDYYLNSSYGYGYYYRQYVDVNSNEGQRYYYDTINEAERNGIIFYRGYPYRGMSSKNHYETKYFNIKQLSSEDIVVERTYIRYAYTETKNLKSCRWWRKSDPSTVYNSLKTTYEKNFVDEAGVVTASSQSNPEDEFDVNDYGDYLNSTMNTNGNEQADPNKSVVEGYSYSIRPLFADLNMFFYVETDNPDPASFTFIDRDSKYYTEDSSLDYLSVHKEIFLDVQYEDVSIYRVNGGYIFSAPRANYATDEIDGGDLILRYRTEEGKYEDSDIVVNCPEVKPLMVYLEDEFTTSDMTLFEKISAVDKGIKSVSLYPDKIADRDTESSTKYPYLTSVSYDDQGVLTRVYINYGKSKNYILMERAYPFTLDSIAQPSTVAAFARYLQSDVKCTQTGVHYIFEIEYNGETIKVGGAGKECHDDVLFSDDIEKCFLFDGSENDASDSITYEWVLGKKEYYNELSYTLFEESKSKVNYTTITKTLGNKGSWVKIYGGYYAYLYYDESKNLWGKNVSPIGNAWVDGRYVDKRGKFIPGTKFEDTLGEYIIWYLPEELQWGSYYFKGETKYRYSKDYDAWIAYWGYWDILEELDSGEELDSYPDELIITREEALSMELDKNTNTDPSKGYIYDGNVEPGTPFGE